MSSYARVVWGGMVRHEVEHQLDAAPGLLFARQTLEPDTAIDLKKRRVAWGVSHGHSLPLLFPSSSERSASTTTTSSSRTTALLNVRVGTAKGDQFTEVSKWRNQCLTSAPPSQRQVLPR